MTYDRPDWERISYAKVEEKYSRVNLIDDGGFESGTKEFWTAVEHCSWENQGDDVYSSDYGAKITIEAGETGIFLNTKMIEAYPGMPIRPTLNYKNDGNVTYVYIYFAYYDEAGNKIGYSTANIGYSVDTWRSRVWATVLDYTKSFAYVRIGIAATAGGSSSVMYLDNFFVPAKVEPTTNEYGHLSVANVSEVLEIYGTKGVAVYPVMGVVGYDNITITRDAAHLITKIEHKLSGDVILTEDITRDANDYITEIDRS